MDLRPATVPPISVEYIQLPGVKLTQREYISEGRPYPCALLLAQVRPHLKSATPQIFTQHPTGHYREKVLRVLDLAIEKGVHFCILPECSLPVSWIPEIREHLRRQAPPNSIFCMPLEHVPRQRLLQVIKEAGAKASYLAEFPQEREEGVLNLCWVCAKGEDSAIQSHFQAKLYPALGQEGPRWQFHHFQGGRILRLFATEDDPPLRFAVLVCFDFIAGGPERPSPVAALQDYLTQQQSSLDWLLVPQFNPKPAHPEFENGLNRFYKQSNCRAAVVAWVNVAGDFSHPLAARGPFGGSCLAGRFSPAYETSITYGRPISGGKGGIVQLSLIAEEDVLAIYADRLPAQRYKAEIGEGRDFLLHFYHYASPATGGPQQWTRFDPQTPPWSPGFYRTRFYLLRELAQRFHRDLNQHLTRGLPQPVPYVDLKLERGEIPPEPFRYREPEREEKPPPLPQDLKRRWEPFQGDLPACLREKYLLVGEVGTGKTSLLLWLSQELAARGKRLPFYLNLRDLGRQVSYESLSRKFRNYISPLVSRRRRARLFDELVDTGSLVFLLDGLDQMVVDDYEAVVRNLLPLVKDNALILATRPTPARYLEDRQDLIFLRIQHFDQAAQQTYFGDTYDDALRLVSRAPDLPAVPILAYLVRELVVAGRAPLVQTRTGLYEAFVDHIFIREKRQRFQTKATKVRSTLHALAFHSLAADPPQLGYADYKVFEKHNEGRVRESDLLGFGLVNSLVERGPGEKPRLFFTHQSFQEFLAARYAWDNPDAKYKNRVIDQMWQPRWREVLKFLVGMDDGGEVLQAIYPGPEVDNVIFSKLFLAAACLQEDPRGNTNFSQALLDRLSAMVQKIPFRINAVETLVRLDTDASRTVLHRLLDQRRLTCSMLAALTSPLPRGLVPFLVPYLNDPDSSCRLAAVEVLGKIKDRLPPELIPSLAQRLEDEHWPVRLAAADILRKLGDPLPPDLILSLAYRRLEDESLYVRLTTFETLGKLGDLLPPGLIPLLVHYLWDNESNVRAAAATALSKLENRLPPDLIPCLVRCLEDEKELEFVRQAAAEALWKLDRLTPELLPPLTHLLEDEKGIVRTAAVEALGKLSDRLPQELIPLLALRLEDEHWPVRLAAVGALGRQGDRLPLNLIPSLAQRLEDKERYVRCEAVEALGRLEDRLTPDLIPLLAQRLEDGDTYVRQATAKALGRLGDRLVQELIPSFDRRLKHNMWKVRHAATKALRELGDRLPPELLSPLAQCLKDSVGEVRWAAVEALGKLGNRLPPELIRQLARCLDDEVSLVRHAAAEALERLGDSLPPELIPSLAQRLEDKNANVRWAAAKALEKLGNRLPPELIPSLAQRLEDENEDSRYTAVWCLQKLAQRDPRIWSLKAPAPTNHPRRARKTS